MLSEKMRAVLLAAARDAIEPALTSRERRSLVDLGCEELQTRRGVFVSIHVDGDLRGCIGVVSPTDTLLDTVTHCAVSAATGDTRFPPIVRDELSRACIEISVLDSPVPVARHDEVILGTHGLIATDGGRSGLLLPQVAVAHEMTLEQFLDAVCLKAGLAAGTWRQRKTILQRFSAQVFAERPAAPQDTRDGG